MSFIKHNWSSRLPDPGHAPHSVNIRTGHWEDRRQAGPRKVSYKHYYPKAHFEGEKLPVVLWSHGLGGSIDGAAFIARFIAGHGYHVIHIQHPGTDDSLWQGKPGDPWEHIRRAHIPRRQTLQRLQDVPFAIDQIERWNESDPDFAGSFDLEAVGMSGHSFGAFTAQVMAGMQMGRGKRLYSLKEPRIRAALPYSPPPSSNKTDPKDRIYGPIDIPLFVMTGTADDSPVGGWPYTWRLPVYNAAGAREKHLLVLDRGDHLVFNGTRRSPPPGVDREAQKRTINVASLAFWDAYLKRDPGAQNSLISGAWLGSGDIYRYNTPYDPDTRPDTRRESA